MKKNFGVKNRKVKAAESGSGFAAAWFLSAALFLLPLLASSCSDEPLPDSPGKSDAASKRETASNGGTEVFPANDAGGRISRYWGTESVYKPDTECRFADLGVRPVEFVAVTPVVNAEQHIAFFEALSRAEMTPGDQPVDHCGKSGFPDRKQHNFDGKRPVIAFFRGQRRSGEKQGEQKSCGSKFFHGNTTFP